MHRGQLPSKAFWVSSCCLVASCFRLLPGKNVFLLAPRGHQLHSKKITTSAFSTIMASIFSCSLPKKIKPNLEQKHAPLSRFFFSILASFISTKWHKSTLQEKLFTIYALGLVQEHAIPGPGDLSTEITSVRDKRGEMDRFNVVPNI